MNSIKLFTISLLLCLSFYSCDSDDDNVNNTQPTTQELLAHKWFLVIEDANACQATSYFDFKTDGSFTTETFFENSDGACLSGGLLEGTYNLLEDNVTLHLNLSTTGIFIIELISTTDLIISPPDEDGELVFIR